jgi:carboxymethylenebutenolidase
VLQFGDRRRISKMEGGRMPGSNVNLSASDGPTTAYLARPEGTGPWPGILFFMDALGPRPTLYAMADRLADLGYSVLLPNMYYRSGSYEPFDPTKIFGASPGTPEFERVMAMANSIEDAAAMRDAAAFFDFLDRDPHTLGPKFGTLGYCMGGGFALGAACSHPGRVAAAASFHGARFVTDAGSPEIIATTLSAAAYVGVAEVDRRHTAETTRHLEEAFTRADVPHSIELYAGTSHGFAVSDLPVFNQAACETHWARVAAFFERHLGGSRATLPSAGQS